MRICPACDSGFDGPRWACPACGHEPPIFEGFPALAPEYALAGEGFHPEYFEELAMLEAGNFWFQARNRLIIDAVRRHFPRLGHYLEVGCGTGFVLSGIASSYPDARVVGTEIFSAGLKQAGRRLPHAELLQMDARRIPFDAHFDLVGAYDVLEHIPEDQDVLAQMYRACKRGGGLAVTVPQHPWLWSPQDDMACHVRRYVAAELRRKVIRAGFRVLEMRSFISLLLPLMWLARMAKRGSRVSIDALAELRIKPATNMLLGAVMSLEYLLSRSGIRFPAGGSLLLIARKD